MRPESLLLAFLGAGLLIVTLVAAACGFGQLDRAVWPAYILLGACAFGSGALALSDAVRVNHRIVRVLVPVLATLAVLGAAVEDVSTGRAYVLLAIALHAVLVWFFGDRADAPTQLERLALIAIGWTIAATLAWFAPLSVVVLQSPDPLVAINVAVLAIIATVFALSGSEHAAILSGRFPQLAGRVLDVAAALFFGLLSLRQDNIGNPISFFHWSFYVGPIELVRHGGWLLWDVPSQYGFLDILAAAVLPLRSAWSAFYVFDAALLWVSALLLFVVLRNAVRGRLGFPFAFLLTLVAVYLIPGNYGQLSGPQFYPSIGAMRFIWVDVVLAILAFDYLRAGRRTAGIWSVLLGTVAWTLGVFWSAESAVYVSVTWLPAYAVMVFGRRAPVHAWALLAVPVAALMLAVGVLEAAYRVGLGHGPDLYAFVEYPLRYGGGFGAYPIAGTGAVWFLLVCFCMMVAVVFVCARGRERPRRALPAAIGAAAATWAIASYFVGRSADSNVTNISGTLWLAVAVILLIVDRERLSVANGIRMLLTGPIVALWVLTLGNAAALEAVGDVVQRGYTFDARALIPILDSERLLLLDEARVKPGDPIVTNISATEPLLPAWPGAADDPQLLWLPLAPPAMFSVLRDDRQALYLDRFGMRVRMDGWFLTTRVEGDACRALDPHYQTVRRYREGRWDLARCHLRQL